MCRAMTRLPDRGFWSAVQKQLDADERLVRLRASYLYAYFEGVEAGEHVRRQVLRDRCAAKYGAG
jgi:hypothetical protein